MFRERPEPDRFDPDLVESSIGRHQKVTAEDQAEIARHSDADSLVETASDPESRLHRLFQWDDTIAGAEYRRMQARQLFRKVKYVHQVIDAVPSRVPRMVNDPVTHTYCDVTKATKESKQMAALRELRRAETHARQAVAYADLAGIGDDYRTAYKAIQRVLKKHG